MHNFLIYLAAPSTNLQDFHMTVMKTIICAQCLEMKSSIELVNLWNNFEMAYFLLKTSQKSYKTMSNNNTTSQCDPAYAGSGEIPI